MSDLTDDDRRRIDSAPLRLEYERQENQILKTRIATLEAEKAERERYMAVRLADFEQRYNYRTVSPNTILNEVTDGVAYEREHGLDSNL